MQKSLRKSLGLTNVSLLLLALCLSQQSSIVYGTGGLPLLVGLGLTKGLAHSLNPVAGTLNAASGFAGSLVNGAASSAAAGLGGISNNALGLAGNIAGGVGNVIGNVAGGFKAAANAAAGAATGVGAGGASSAASSASAGGGAAAASSSAAEGGFGGPFGGGFEGPGFGYGGGFGGPGFGGFGGPGYGGFGGYNGASAASAASAGGAMGGLNPIGTTNVLSGAGSLGGAAGAIAAGAAASSVSSAAAATDNVVGGGLAAAVLGREALANEAFDNAQAEASIAGADMMAHGANNARSASLASNAYRQAKLASARDRVNIAGTIQNSARISDAAIATHDAATKAEDSLLGSEIAVDSAATVLDSDAAYIPPVTNSLLRSLPYGRLGLRNIIPKPLTYPSHLLPDVWLNGQPVNYLNVPLRQLQYGGATASAAAGAFGGIGGAYFSNMNQLQASGSALANGYLSVGQPFYSFNGWPINGLVMDPTSAFLSTSMYGCPPGGSSVYPILANGQLEAQDEIAAANMITMQQQAGAGMLSTYFGFGRMNPVPLLTGTVSEANLAPTTTIGTTYPIGSALVIEPRDSYFQDYIDSASSRQNYDERQQ